MNPFLKWAGGKRWLVTRPEFEIPEFTGRYIEPFLGGGAVFFHCRPAKALLSDINPRLIDTYQAIKSDWEAVLTWLKEHQDRHSNDYYYDTRKAWSSDLTERGAQFLYLNRTCWNGLYRENLRGEFNVPKGTKNTIVFENEDLALLSAQLSSAELKCCDFSDAIATAGPGDFLFVDPPYTTAHNNNGFVKYNEGIFTWDDQIRLRDSLALAAARGAKILMTNADHTSVRELYEDHADLIEIGRASVISGGSKGRGRTTELLISNLGGKRVDA